MVGFSESSQITHLFVDSDNERDCTEIIIITYIFIRHTLSFQDIDLTFGVHLENSLKMWDQHF